MTDALLADLRALADALSCEWTNGPTCEETCCVNGQVAALIAKHEARPDVSERDELAQASAWIAEAIGYPVDTKIPDPPMPESLWQALVDHVHADESGRWHGNELDRDEVESWLADEAGRRR